jgi:hypothetical protein
MGPPLWHTYPPHRGHVARAGAILEHHAPQLVQKQDQLLVEGLRGVRIRFTIKQIRGFRNKNQLAYVDSR